MWSDELQNTLKRKKIIAVLVIERSEHALRTASALARGGVDIIELTLRTPAAFESIQRIRASVPEVLVGAGTVLSPDDCARAVHAGASFLVAPGFNPNVVKAAAEHGVPFAPGIATPSELEKAYALGCKILKLFPAQALGGLPWLKSMNGPYKHLELQYIPLGGLSAENLKDWLAYPPVIAVGGSWLAPHELIIHEQWDQIEQRARKARHICDRIYHI
ncbi:MAG: bifunctional 4-hydroxy-2-oxoglutarate aldolase/2-dehydro-3-deoxy-phosphogluconate aldolase [Salinispira sp.]